MKGSNDKTMLSETRGLKSSSCVEIVTHTLALAMDPDMIMFNGQCSMKTYQVVIAAGSHLFPFRTEKLSPPAPMVLQCNAGE